MLTHDTVFMLRYICIHIYLDSDGSFFVFLFALLRANITHVSATSAAAATRIGTPTLTKSSSAVSTARATY
jgi:hypothetical protein